MKLIGYHGTDARTANLIEREGFADSSESAWLGAGVYFFEDCPNICKGIEHAKWWVSTVKKFNYWVIFKANISSTKVFDLVCNENDRRRYEELTKHLLAKHLESGKKESDFSCHDVILQLRKKVEVIRCFVDASKANSKFTSYIVGQPQIQFCVCKNSEIVIQNYSRIEGN